MAKQKGSTCRYVQTNYIHRGIKLIVLEGQVSDSIMSSGVEGWPWKIYLPRLVGGDPTCDPLEGLEKKNFGGRI